MYIYGYLSNDIFLLCFLSCLLFHELYIFRDKLDYKFIVVLLLQCNSFDFETDKILDVLYITNKYTCMIGDIVFD